MDFIGTSINYDDNSEGVNFKDDYWITRYNLPNLVPKSKQIVENEKNLII